MLWAWLVWPLDSLFSGRSPSPHEHVPLHRLMPRTVCVYCQVTLYRARGLWRGKPYWLTARGCADVLDGRPLVEGDGMTFGGEVCSEDAASSAAEFVRASC